MHRKRIHRRILAYMTLAMVLSACGGSGGGSSQDGAKQDAAPGPDQHSFAGEIRPIVEAQCLPCHGADSSLPDLVSDAESFRAKKDAIIARVTTEDPAKMMPPADSAKSLSEEGRNKILSFLEG